MRMLPFFALLLSSAFFPKSWAQSTDSFLFPEPIILDEVVVRATRSGFDVQQFIERIQQDTTFYKAFKRLHLTTYNAEHQILVFQKRTSKKRASLISETKQIYRDNCRTMNVLEEKTTGDFYRKDGSYRYFTAELYAKLFFTKGKICNENDIVEGSLEQEIKGKNRVEKSKVQLKHLMFRPGSKIDGIPLMGNKMALFDPGNARYYRFHIKAEEKNGIPAYLFEAVAKDEDRNKVVIKVFKTWLAVSDFSIVSRDYELSYNAGVYDFDVRMHVDLAWKNKRLLPTYIRYDGNWHVLTKGRERVRFETRFDY